jgi:hypothetical protein
MTLHEILKYLEQEMPDRVTPNDLAAFLLSILSGYMDSNMETMVAFLRDVADSVEASNVAPDDES